MRPFLLLAISSSLFLFPACKQFKNLEGNLQTAGSKSGLGSSSSSSGPWARRAMTDDYAESCHIPTHTDDAAGFEVGQPKGWELDFGNGTIEVSKDASGMTGALIYPARLRQGDIPAEKLADIFGSQLGHAIEARGGTFALADKASDGHIATARATATVNGMNLKGPLQVVSEKGFAVVKLYWAPVDKFDAEEPELKQVVTCFRRQLVVVRNVPPPRAASSKSQAHASTASAPVPALKPFQTKFFTGSMPEGWKVVDETANGIDLKSGDGTMAVGFGWISNPMSSPQQMTRDSVHRFHPHAKVLKAGPIPASQPGQIAYAAEYEEQIVHGYDQTTRGQGVAVTLGLLASPAKWDASHATLQAIAQTIQVTPAGVAQVQANVRAFIATLPKPQPSPSVSTSSASSSSSSSVMQRWADQDKQNQEFSDAILGQDRAVSPSTGAEYTVPYSAWNPSGPQGAGYYRLTPGGSTELLDVPAQ